MVMDHRAADDDVGQLTTPMEKNYRCRTYTPLAGEERDSDKRRWGLVSMVMITMVFGSMTSAS